MASNNAMSSESFLACQKARRSYYNLTKSSFLSGGNLEKLLSDTMISTPTPFNAQSNRVVVLLGPHHDFLWNVIVPKVLEPYVQRDEDSKKHTADRLKKFAQAAGTILCFVDATSSARVASKFPTYSKLMPQWEEHSNGMLQYAIWLALTAAGMGCNIQHYNPLIDSEIKQHWNIASSWELKAQMVFGSLADGEVILDWTENKEIQPLHERLLIYSSPNDA